MKLFFTIFFLTILLYPKYLDNKSCKECHEAIYKEFEESMHSKSYFNDELHRKVANAADSIKYECAYCHMPMADNLQDLVTGKAKPDKNNKTHTDGISCYFCHTIAYVKKAHKFNINIKARQAQNYKPTLFGRLNNPDHSDKHSSVSNPIYAKAVCMGCHSHKLNDNNVTIFRAMKKGQNSIECINCHMPEVEGGAEKVDRRARGHHASHKFLGIHDIKFRKKGLDINASVNKDRLIVTLKNKMAHPLIIQPARAKFLKITIKRDGKVVWSNYKVHPSEDKQAYFAYSFTRNGKKIIIPSKATKSSANNIDAKESKKLIYKIPKLQNGDKINISYFVQFAKSDCLKAIDISNKKLIEPQLIKSVTLELNSSNSKEN